jgi:hypothetical protein
MLLFDQIFGIATCKYENILKKLYLFKIPGRPSGLLVQLLEERLCPWRQERLSEAGNGPAGLPRAEDGPQRSPPAWQEAEETGQPWI